MYCLQNWHFIITNFLAHLPSRCFYVTGSIWANCTSYQNWACIMHYLKIMNFSCIIVVLTPNQHSAIFKISVAKAWNRLKSWTLAESFLFLLYPQSTIFKGPYADHILIPQGSTGRSTFFDIKLKAHIFLFANPKFQLQILYSFGDITKNGKLNGIPEKTYVFHNRLIPRGAYFILPLESKQATSGWNFTKCISEVKVN